MHKVLHEIHIHFEMFPRCSYVEETMSTGTIRHYTTALTTWCLESQEEHLFFRCLELVGVLNQQHGDKALGRGKPN